MNNRSVHKTCSNKESYDEANMDVNWKEPNKYRTTLLRVVVIPTRYVSRHSLCKRGRSIKRITYSMTVTGCRIKNCHYFSKT